MARPIALNEVMSVPDIVDQVRFSLRFGSIPLSGSSESLTIKCQQAVYPETGNESYVANMHGHRRNFRGRLVQGETLSCTFYEDATGGTLQQLETWHQAIVGIESGNSEGYVKDYSVLAELSAFDTTGKEYSRVQFVELYIFQKPETQYSTESSSAVLVQCNFKFAHYKKVGVVVR